MVIVTVCFVASLSPFLMPGALIGFVGNGLNGALADPVWTLLLPARGTLVASGSDGPLLTLQGVLAVYVPLLVILLRQQQGR
jgi:hypothetical protein